MLDVVTAEPGLAFVESECRRAALNMFHRFPGRMDKQLVAEFESNEREQAQEIARCRQLIEREGKLQEYQALVDAATGAFDDVWKAVSGSVSAQPTVQQACEKDSLATLCEMTQNENLKLSRAVDDLAARLHASDNGDFMPFDRRLLDDPDSNNDENPDIALLKAAVVELAEANVELSEKVYQLESRPRIANLDSIESMDEMGLCNEVLQAAIPAHLGIAAKELVDLQTTRLAENACENTHNRPVASDSQMTPIKNSHQQTKALPLETPPKDGHVQPQQQRRNLFQVER